MTQEKTIAQFAAEAKSDQLNSADLIGAARIIKITKITLGTAEQRMVIHFEGDEKKPYKPCRSMVRLLNYLWGDNEQRWIGKSMRVVCDPDVIFGKDKVGGIRITHVSDITSEKKVLLRSGKIKTQEYSVLPLNESKSESKKPAPAPEADPALLEDGEENASRGVEAYTAWLATLTPEVKATIKHKHKDWTKLAQEADKPQPLETLE